MNFDPEKLSIGVIDFFSILMPGAILVYLAKGWGAVVLGLTSLQLQGPEGWMIFLFMAYLLGHVTFLLGSLLDQPYDWLRKGTHLGQSRRLANGKRLSSRGIRGFASWLFGRDADAAVVAAARISARTLSDLSAENSINTYQWCKARLSKDHPAGLAAVQRFEADSKFFRSFAVVLLALAAFSVFHYQCQDLLLRLSLCLAFLLLVLWRYIDQRFKATQQAYWLVVTLEGMKGPSIPAVFEFRTGELTHAGGVVFRKRKASIEYLLIQATKNPLEWVLPKGHIEPGESPREAAVREVREETGYWAQVVRWIDDARFGSGAEAMSVRFFLMELAPEEEEKKWPPENRQHQWLSLDDANQKASFKETRQLLEKASELLKDSAPAMDSRH